MKMWSSISFVHKTALVVIVCPAEFMRALQVFADILSPILWELANVNGTYSI